MSTRWRCGAFTLTELLVVLSILAVLGAMAVPALRAALDRADRTVCLANLRQLGQAMSEFVDDYGHYPAQQLDVRDASGRVVERKRWYHALAPYLDANPTSWSSGQGRAAIDTASGIASSVVLPSEDDRDQDVFPRVLRCPSCKAWEYGRNGSYGYNHQYLGDARILDASHELIEYRCYPVTRDALLDPARTIVLTDSRGTGDGPYRGVAHIDATAIGNHAFTIDPPTLPLRGGIRFGSDTELPGIGIPSLRSSVDGRHRGGACVLFADLRVEWVPLDQLTMNDALFNGTGVASQE